MTPDRARKDDVLPVTEVIDESTLIEEPVMTDPVLPDGQGTYDERLASLAADGVPGEPVGGYDAVDRDRAGIDTPAGLGNARGYGDQLEDDLGIRLTSFTPGHGPFADVGTPEGTAAIGATAPAEIQAGDFDYESGPALRRREARAAGYDLVDTPGVQYFEPDGTGPVPVEFSAPVAQAAPVDAAPAGYYRSADGYLLPEGHVVHEGRIIPEAEVPPAGYYRSADGFLIPVGHHVVDGHIVPIAAAAPAEYLPVAVIEDDRPVIRKLTKAEQRAIDAKGRLSSPWASGIAVLLAILWTIPSLGLFVTSFREQLSINQSGWWTALGDLFGGSGLTLSNYHTALFGGDTNLFSFFINSFAITLPAVVIPITIALLAAYAFAWIDFPFRNVLFVAVFALQVVPLQVALVPLMRNYLSWGISGSFWAVWFSHSIFALPLAIFLLHNFMKEIPSSLVEAARVDGAGHVKIFFRVLLPLLVPAIASFGIFQFLWVWNDLLVGLTFANPAFQPLTVRVAELAGTRGGQWHLLTAGAFISMIVPLIVFLSLQRYFVRGLLAGSVKG